MKIKIFIRFLIEELGEIIREDFRKRMRRFSIRPVYYKFESYTKWYSY